MVHAPLASWQHPLPSHLFFNSMQVFEFQPDPGLQTIAFERPDLVEAVRELGAWHCWLHCHCLPVCLPARLPAWQGDDG